MRLLIVEDDPKLVRALELGLGREGFAVEIARDGEAALRQAGTGGFDAIVLDIMLPGPDGFAVCEALRLQGVDTPVLMLTARADVGDRIRGLNGGADDYLVKPFDFGELLARLRALTRRPRTAPDPSGPRDVLRAGSLEIDAQRSLVTSGDRSVELSARELAVLQCLARHERRVVSRAELLEEVWGAGFGGSPNLVDVYIGYLRKKLDEAFGRRLIRTVRGRGFELDPR